MENAEEKKLKLNMLAILQSRPHGSTFPQFFAEFRSVLGEDFCVPHETSNFSNREEFLIANYSDIIRFEKAGDGETFLHANTDIVPKKFETKRYEVNLEISNLIPDSRGWYTICFIAPKGVFIESVLRQEFEELGQLAEFHVSFKGKVFVRYLSLDNAVSALRRYGHKYRIQAGINRTKEKSIEINSLNCADDKTNSTKSCSIIRDSKIGDLNNEILELDIAKINLNEKHSDTSKPCIHSTTPCRYFPNCLKFCDFLHPVCPNGDSCKNENCRFVHSKGNDEKKSCHLCDVANGVGQQTPSKPMEWRFDCEHRNLVCKSFPHCKRTSGACSFKHPLCPFSCKEWKTCIYDHVGQKRPCYVCRKHEINEDGNKSLVTICRYGKNCHRLNCFFDHPRDWKDKACPWGISCNRENCSFIHPVG